MARPLEDVYCTLLMSDSYLPGAAVLAHSLRDAGTTKKLAVLVTLDTLSADTITQLKALYDYIIPVERIRTPRPANLYLMGRPDLSSTFTKIALWKQMQFRKIVYLDADVVALRALDELFAIDAPFAAAPDIGWPDAFNSGVMVITPSMGEYWALQTMAAAGESFDGADQGLLNQYFEHRPWQRLKFTYNCTPNAEYQWEPAYRYYKRDISAVHFIGKEKPWSGNRSTGFGVYGELLARWWAVHDRHLRKPTTLDLQRVQGVLVSRNGQPVPEIVIEPEAPVTTTEPDMADLGEEAENIDQGFVEPTPTVEQRKFSAPEMEWDATRFEPPAKSKPEAANFPSATYTFSDSPQLFKAPVSYPEPPKDMWYKVPETKPRPAEAPKPIFPWERDANRPKATRVFAEDLPPSPKPAEAPVPATSSPKVSSPVHSFSTVHYQDDRASPRPEHTSPKSPSESWQAFQQTSGNAWDSVPGIDTYVRAIMDSQARRGSIQVLQQATGTEDIGSPTMQRKNRRESLILTDFPTAIERPSLPVTPAPIRRPTFWGEEKDEVNELPPAEGVPEQPDWVCPQCGFSSFHASDFSRSRELHSSVAEGTVSSSAIVVVDAEKPGAGEQEKPAPKPTAKSAVDPPQKKIEPTAVEKPVKKPLSTTPHPPLPPPGPPRSGLSASGVPLASLTDPSLLPTRSFVSDFVASSTSASAALQQPPQKH